MTSKSLFSKLFSSGDEDKSQPESVGVDPHASMQSSSSSSSFAHRYGLRVLKEPKAREGDFIIDIVFVHGLTGNRESTWTGGKTFWPETLLPAELPQARIMTFGYDADVVKFWSSAGQNRIGNHAQNLTHALANLRDKTDTPSRPILFVAHSLGGLVCENAILKSKNSAEAYMQNIISSTRGIVFMGTPHCGSSLAQWASLCGNFTNLLRRTNKNILAILEPDSEVLASIQEEFHTMLRARTDQGKPAIKLMCFVEELPVVGVGMIVPPHSAILPAYSSATIHANHMDMTKFDDPEDPGFVAVSTTLWRWARDLASDANANEGIADGSQSRSTRRAIEDSTSQGDNAWHTINQFGGQNLTNGGRVFQGNIDAQGNVTIN